MWLLFLGYYFLVLDYLKWKPFILLFKRPRCIHPLLFRLFTLELPRHQHPWVFTCFMKNDDMSWNLWKSSCRPSSSLDCLQTYDSANSMQVATCFIVQVIRKVHIFRIYGFLIYFIVGNGTLDYKHLVYNYQVYVIQAGFTGVRPQSQTLGQGRQGR